MADQTPFAELLGLAHVADPVAFFGRRANRTTIANWKAGRYPAPQWAIDRLRLRWHELDSNARQKLDQIKTGPGKRAGAINLARYLAGR